jgi:hypothetical protein
LVGREASGAAWESRDRCQPSDVVLRQRAPHAHVRQREEGTMPTKQLTHAADAHLAAWGSHP